MTVPQQLSALSELASVKSPSLSAVSVLAKRAAASPEQFYPPQIVEAISLFSRIGLADRNALSHLFLARRDDVLNEASPKRMVELVEAFANLDLPLCEHTELWPEFRTALIRVIPQLKRGVATVIKSLASLRCTDTELLHALLVQAECVRGEVEHQFFTQAIEAASRVQGLEEPVRTAIDVLLNERKKFSVLQSVDLLTAALRSSHSASDKLANRIEEHLASSDVYSQARVLAAMGRQGLKSKSVGDVIEKSLNNADFKHRMLPHTLWAGALVGGADEVLNLVLRNQIMGHIDRLSADKLLAVLRSAAVIGAEPESVAAVKDALATVAQQLSIRQQRLLWEVAPGLTSVAPLATCASGSETVGPYCLQNGSLRMAPFQAYRPGTSELRRDVALRLTALKAATGADVVISHS